MFFFLTVSSLLYCVKFPCYRRRLIHGWNVEYLDENDNNFVNNDANSFYSYQILFYLKVARYKFNNNTYRNKIISFVFNVHFFNRFPSLPILFCFLFSYCCYSSKEKKCSFSFASSDI